MEIVQLFSNYCFPIACCIALMWFYKDTTDKHREEIKELNAEHKEESNKFAEAVNNNTKILTLIYEKLDINKQQR